MNRYWLIIILVICSLMSSTYATQKAFSEINENTIEAQGKYISDNVESFYARWKAVIEAKESIYIDVFFFGNDVFTKALLGALLVKAKEGVQITILADSKAQQPKFAIDPIYFKQLVHYGNVRVVLYNSLLQQLAYTGVPLITGKLWLLNAKNITASNHDKIMVIDNETVIMGGRNIGIEYFANPIDLPIAWRDSDILLKLDQTNDANYYLDAIKDELEVTTNDKLSSWIDYDKQPKLALEMLQSYRAVKKWIIGESFGTLLNSYPSNKKELLLHQQMRQYKNYNDDNLITIKLKVLDKFSYMNKPSNKITNNLVSMIDSTSKELIIQNPYVILTDKIFDALKRAHQRGVAIILHTNSPKSTDSLMTQSFFIDDWDRIRRELPNMQIYAFVGERKMHSKLFVFDRQITAVGTYNLDPMSEDINSEIVTLIQSEQFAAQVLTALESDISCSFNLTSKNNGKNFSPISLADPEIQKKIKLNLNFKFIRPLI